MEAELACEIARVRKLIPSCGKNHWANPELTSDLTRLPRVGRRRTSPQIRQYLTDLGLGYPASATYPDYLPQASRRVAASGARGRKLPARLFPYLTCCRKVLEEISVKLLRGITTPG